MARLTKGYAARVSFCRAHCPLPAPSIHQLSPTSRRPTYAPIHQLSPPADIRPILPITARTRQVLRPPRSPVAQTATRTSIFAPNMPFHCTNCNENLRNRLKSPKSAHVVAVRATKPQNQPATPAFHCTSCNEMPPIQHRIHHQSLTMYLHFHSYSSPADARPQLPAISTHRRTSPIHQLSPKTSTYVPDPPATSAHRRMPPATSYPHQPTYAPPHLPPATFITRRIRTTTSYPHSPTHAPNYQLPPPSDAPVECYDKNAVEKPPHMK